MTTAFSARGVCYGVQGVGILLDVTLDVSYGKVMALVGPNGAGKSSLLGILGGDLAPTGGSVTLDGRAVRDWSARELARRRAVLLQANQVSFSFSAREVVEMGRSPWAGDGRSDEDDDIVRDAMARADVTHLAHRPFPALSSGEKARVSLARVLAQRTPALLLDEPTAALDLRHQEEVLRLGRELAAEGRAIVVVLHDLSLAAAYADEIVMIAGGRIAARGTPTEVLTAVRVEHVYGTPVRILDDPDTGLPVVLPRRRRDESAASS